MDSVDRIKAVLEYEEITREELARKTGMNYTRWANIFKKQVKLRAEELEAMGKIWPQYRLWIAYGDEIPEVGQISPMTASKGRYKSGDGGKSLLQIAEKSGHWPTKKEDPPTSKG